MLAFVCISNLVAQQFFEANPLSINTSSKELAPAFYKNGLVFCSDRKNEWFISYTDLQDNPLTNLYLTEQKETGKFVNPQLFSKNITTRLFEGPATFSRDGNRVFFTRSIDVSPGFRKQVRKDTTFGIFTDIFSSITFSGLKNKCPFGSSTSQSKYVDVFAIVAKFVDTSVFPVPPLPLNTLILILTSNMFYSVEHK